jgi:hypothetical protein
MVSRKPQIGAKVYKAAQLPPCPGPKLDAFEHPNAPIVWLERLDEDRNGQSGTQGFVFKVLIRSSYYALKVVSAHRNFNVGTHLYSLQFKHFDPQIICDFLGPIRGRSVPLDLISYHADPFFAECRAYGRIKEQQDKGKLKRSIAIPSVGFLVLGKKYLLELEKKGIDLWEFGPKDATRQEVITNFPVRAIIKELVEDGPGVDRKTVRATLANIRELNKMKIYHRDVRAENFRGGLFLDFGSAWAEPHCILDAMNKREAEEERGGDLVLFDEMVESEQINTPVRALPNLDFRMKLRSWEK